MRRRRNQRGAALTELVVVFPVLVAVVLAIVQFGVWYHAAAVARAAADEGVRAVRAAGGSEEAGRRRTGEFLAQLGRGVLHGPQVSTRRGGDVAVVEIRASVPPVLPGLRLPVSARAESETLADAQRLVAVKMRAHVELGDAAAAVAAYRELLADLADVDPGLDPDPEVLELYRSITGARRDQ